MPLKAIRCTYPACACDSFSPSKSQVRLCQGCKHGWVAHALDKLATSGPYNFGPQVESVSANVAFDVASLMLYGSQAVPIRLKILLDRLFSALPHDDVLQVLHGFGWSHEDYARGYILLDSTGRMLDRWTVINKDEEYIVVQQFLRFAETRTLAQEIILQETRSNQEFARLPPRTESDIKKFIERNNLAIMQSYNLTVRRAFEAPPPVSSQLFAGMPFPPHLASLHHAAFPTVGSIGHSQLMASLKQETCSEGTSPRSAAAGTTPPAAATAGGRQRPAEPFDLRTRTPESAATKSPTTSSHSSPTIGASALSAVALSHAIPSAVLKIDSALASLPSRSVTPSRQSYPYGEEGAINLSKDSSSFGATAAPGSATVSPKPAAAISRHRQQQQHQSSSQSSGRSISVSGGWPYGASFGSAVFVGASGKKRVLCTACNKTFCDKGALKIHYSAVHLKEMHRCTIPGCTMMFSSRRSRNRHSANPNPKLHTPQTPRRPRERMLDGSGGSLSHRSGLGGSSGNLSGSQLASTPNTDEDSCGGGVGADEDDDDGMDACEDNDDEASAAYYAGVGDRERLPGAPAAHGSSGGTSMRRGENCGRRAADNVEEDGENEDEHFVGGDGSCLRYARRGQTSGPSSSAYPRSNKRKCLMPTRVAAAAPTDGYNSENDERSDMRYDMADGDQDLDSHSSDSCSSYVGSRGAVVVKPEPAETPHSDGDEASQGHHCADVNERSEKTILAVPRFHLNEIDTKQQSALQALFSSFLPRGDQVDTAYWASKSSLGVAADAAKEAERNGSHSDSDSDCSAESGDGRPQSALSAGNDAVPVDPHNPRQCTACSKVFQNQFYMKIHYQNVHLKVMHRCIINGCTASFPSKRSRDRHSSNVNLHRKHVEEAVPLPGESPQLAAHRQHSSEPGCRTLDGGKSDDGHTSSGGSGEPKANGRVCDRTAGASLMATTALVKGEREGNNADSKERERRDGQLSSSSCELYGAGTHVEARLSVQPDADSFGGGKGLSSQVDKYGGGGSNRMVVSESLPHQPVIA